MVPQPPNCDGYNLDLIYIENDFVKFNKTLTKNGTSCEWKCSTHIIGNTYTLGDWQPITKKVDCEILKVKCYSNDGEIIYKAPQFIFKPKPLQPIPKPEPSKENSFDNESLFNVHILVLDSVSRSHAIRAIPKTINYLIHELSAFDFHYFNKVGFNSNPNGYAAFVGKHAPNPMITPHFAKPLFDSQFYEKHYIGNIFERSGFPVLLSEEVFSIFALRNFTEPLKQMHMLYPLFEDSLSYSFFHKCYTATLKYMLNYWSSFISAYEKRPKFSMNWNVFLAHDSPVFLFAGDDILIDFMMKHKDELDNSFLIDMADHGSMFGYHRFEDVMAYEDNNPMLFISLPKALRNDEALNSALKANTQKLVTQYDIYATLIEIASKLGVQIRENLTLHGQSLFKEVPSERNCYTLGISPVYCLCRFDEIPLPSDDPLHSKIVNQIILHSNRTIFSARNNCTIYQLDPNFVPQIIQILVPNPRDYLVYKITFQSQYFKDIARWLSYAYVDPNQNLIRQMETWHRLDPFGKRNKNFCEFLTIVI